MPHILKNKNLEVHIDLPTENYNFSRFDWTGKIVKLIFNNIPLSGTEITNCDNEHQYGKGFYNEFGIDTALGFAETEVGDWFHKIGIGLLKKEGAEYLFNKNYKIKPADFNIETDLDKILIICKSDFVNGYSYILTKEIKLQGNSFIINYNLKNTGDNVIITDEYVHNFTAINNDLIGSNYVLKFPFKLQPKLFNETVNPENKVEIKQNEITFNDIPNDQFFFSNLSGHRATQAKWELTNLNCNISICETGSFETKKVNLWGWKHVISPELFFQFSVEPGQSQEWTRTYHLS